MTAAAAVLTGLAKLKRQDSARSQHRPVPPTSPGLGNHVPEAAPRSSSQPGFYSLIIKIKVVFKIKRPPFMVPTCYPFLTGTLL